MAGCLQRVYLLQQVDDEGVQMHVGRRQHCKAHQQQLGV